MSKRRDWARGRKRRAPVRMTYGLWYGSLHRSVSGHDYMPIGYLLTSHSACCMLWVAKVDGDETMSQARCVAGQNERVSWWQAREEDGYWGAIALDFRGNDSFWCLMLVRHPRGTTVVTMSWLTLIGKNHSFLSPSDFIQFLHLFLTCLRLSIINAASCRWLTSHIIPIKSLVCE